MLAAVNRISLFLNLAIQGLINVYFVDESGFSLQPYIPYRYQKKGQQMEIKSVKTRVMNVLGFLNPLTQRLITYPLEEGTTMNSEIFIKFISDFAAKLTLPTVLILDNASWHKSKETKAMFSTWQKQGLFIYFLPPRCPHLNLIETLWRKIKYEWLFNRDFYSKATMEKKLKHIFKNYGSEYKLEFSFNIFNVKINW